MFLREVRTKAHVKCADLCSVLLFTVPHKETTIFLTYSSMDAYLSVVLINFVPFVCSLNKVAYAL